MTPKPTLLEIDWTHKRVALEIEWVSGPPGGPLLVFLHEGLGSVSMWRDFPQQLCKRMGARGLLYSRPGYGRSSPRAPDERWDVDFMHRQAHEVLPALLQALGVQEPIWLLGHSDGGSIALLYAARHGPSAGAPPPTPSAASGESPAGPHRGSARSAFLGAPASGRSAAPEAPPLAGAIVLAPHILVEEVSLRSIERSRQAYLQGDLRQRLARHHEDPDSAFWGWNEAWLNPAFRGWSIEADLHHIQVPVLAVQGLDDEYGTLEQIRGIARRVPHTELLELPACGHSPHRDQPQALMDAVAGFVGRHMGQ